MKYFVDLGAYKGQGIKEFYNKQLVENTDDYAIYCFEPQNFDEEWKKIKKEYKNVCLMKYAAWLFDGKVKFSVAKNNTFYKSGVMKEKIDYGEGKKIMVPCIDFSRFVCQFKKDYLIVKMDIEGAEFPILEKMIKDNTIQYVDKLFVEWHDTKMIPPMTDRKYKILEKIKELKIDYKDWET